MATITDTATTVKRGFHGIEAQTIKTVKGQTWDIFTMKRYSGKLVTTAQACKVSHNFDTGFSCIQYTPSQDAHLTLISEVVRVTEKAVRQQHEKALQLFEQQVN